MFAFACLVVFSLFNWLSVFVCVWCLFLGVWIIGCCDFCFWIASKKEQTNTNTKTNGTIAKEMCAACCCLVFVILLLCVFMLVVGLFVFNACFGLNVRVCFWGCCDFSFLRLLLKKEQTNTHNNKTNKGQTPTFCFGLCLLCCCLCSCLFGCLFFLLSVEAYVIVVSCLFCFLCVGVLVVVFFLFPDCSKRTQTHTQKRNEKGQQQTALLFCCCYFVVVCLHVCLMVCFPF